MRSGSSYDKPTEASHMALLVKHVLKDRNGSIFHIWAGATLGTGPKTGIAVGCGSGMPGLRSSISLLWTALMSSPSNALRNGGATSRGAADRIVAKLRASGGRMTAPRRATIEVLVAGGNHRH